MERRAAELQARQATVSAFGDLVNAMRGVAASRAQRARARIEGVDAYAATVTSAMAQARALGPPDATRESGATGAPLWVVFCAEQGFNGGFSEQVLASVPPTPSVRVLLLGTQGLRLARSRGIEPEWSAPLIAHAEATVAAGERLHSALDAALSRRRAGGVVMVYAELQAGQRFEVRRQRLLPLEQEDAAASAPGPLTHLPPTRLLEELLFEHVAAQLTRAILHSHAAENLSRLQAMASAHENVTRMVEALRADERRLRQESITAEIVELAAGLRALRAA